jgi:hypothetical protein
MCPFLATCRGRTRPPRSPMAVATRLAASAVRASRWNMRRSTQFGAFAGREALVATTLTTPPKWFVDNPIYLPQTHRCGLPSLAADGFSSIVTWQGGFDGAWTAANLVGASCRKWLQSHLSIHSLPDHRGREFLCEPAPQLAKWTNGRKPPRSFWPSCEG